MFYVWSIKFHWKHVCFLNTRFWGTLIEGMGASSQSLGAHITALGAGGAAGFRGLTAGAADPEPSRAPLRLRETPPVPNSLGRNQRLLFDFDFATSRL